MKNEYKYNQNSKNHTIHENIKGEENPIDYFKDIRQGILIG